MPTPGLEGAERGGDALPRPVNRRLTASDGPRTPLTVKGLLDVVVLVVAAPIALVPGLSGRAYLIAAGIWIVLRGVGVAVDRTALAMKSVAGEIGLRLAYLLGRLGALGVMVVLLRDGVGKAAALTALVVILVAFTIELTISAAYRPRRR